MTKIEEQPKHPLSVVREATDRRDLRLAVKQVSSALRSSTSFDEAGWREAIAELDSRFGALVALEALSAYVTQDNELRATAWIAAIETWPQEPLLCHAAVLAMRRLRVWNKSPEVAEVPIFARLREVYGPELDEAFVGLVAHGAEVDAATVTHVIGRFPQRMLRWAVSAFSADHEQTAANAVDVLGALGPAGRTALLDQLRASRADLRLRAIDALMRSPGPDLVPSFEAALTSDRSKKVKDRLASALYELQGSDVPDFDSLERTPASHAQLDELLSRNAPAAPRGAELDALPLRWSSGAEVSHQALARILARLDDEGPQDAELQSLRDHLDPRSATATLDALRAQFDPEDRVARLGWVLDATVLFASSDDLVGFGRDLDELARFGSSAEAFRRLAVLRWHGGPPALEWIDHWARHAQSRGLRERAHQALRDLAEERDLSLSELSERAMSTFGFDADGRQQVDWGARGAMTLSLGPGNKLLLHDASGKQWSRYPSALAGDDPDEIAAVKSHVIGLKKQVRQALRGQVDRLELALATGREWSPRHWLDVYLSHPLIASLAPHILWAIFVDGEYRDAFRLETDHSFADVRDEPLELPDDARIRVAHPLYLRDDEPKIWSDLFVDYELVPPFDQFQRPVFEPTRAELSADALHRWDGASVALRALRRHLRRRGWLRGAVRDGGRVISLIKPVREADLTAVLYFSPGSFGHDPEEEQDVREVEFLEGVVTDEREVDARRRIGSIEPVVFSEVVYDIEALLSSPAQAALL